MVGIFVRTSAQYSSRVLLFFWLILIGASAYAQECGGGTSRAYAGSSLLLPNVEITNPSFGANFTTSSAISIAAVADGAGSSITAVQFHALNSTGVKALLATDQIFPFATTWKNPPAGAYTLTATVSTLGGCSGTSPGVPITVSGSTSNLGPAVSLTAPVNGAAFSAPATISLAASASDLDGTISKVEFFNGSTLLATDATSPYSFNWSNVQVGTYTLTARATDNGGAIGVSIPVTVTVTAPLPVVNLTSPAAGSSFNDPASITLVAAASITSGTISKVEFLDGAVLLATDTTSPYSAVWTGGAVGSHSLTARATSSLGTVATSPAVVISISNPAPSVSMTAPANGASFSAPATITLSANASDSNGSITKVEFFNGATLLGTDTAAPYSVVWSNVAAGNYNLTAKATDNAGAMKTSPVVTVAVVAPNLGPTVSLTAPANGAVFTVPFSTPLSASASDANGVSKVEFFDNGVLIGSADTVAPYSVNWSSTTLGSHSLTARATDGLGAVSTSALVVATVARVALTASNKTVTSSVAAGSTASATFRLASAGKIRFQTSAGGAFDEQSPLDEWLEPESAVTAASFEAMATPVTGAVSSGVMNQWLNLGSATARDWVLTRSVTGTSQAVIAIQIRRVGTATALASTDVTLNATVAPPPNVSPNVSLTDPLDGTAFDAPVNIVVAATASDADGTVSKVEFFNGATLLSTDATAPYSFVWSNVPAGSHTLTAMATDNSGAMTVSTPVAFTVAPSANLAPTVSLTEPLNGASFAAPATIQLAADAIDTDGSVVQVSFYQGTTLLATDTEAPYSFKWSAVPAGTYTITATALDDGFASSTSAAVTVTVDTCPPMTVALTSPSDGAVFDAPATITLGAVPSTCAGSISKVEFYEGTTLLVTDTDGPFYAAPWSPVGAGTYSLTAKAYNTLGDSVVSAISTITVNDGNAVPVVSLTNPADNATFNQGAPITLQATATDTDGTISTVEFFDGTSPIGPGTANGGTYTRDWTTATIGTHTITAKATDNNNAVTTSAARTITVNSSPLTVTLTAPLNGDSFTAPATITLSADASTLNGTVTAVEFFKDDGATLLGHATETTSPYTFIWSDVPAGAYTLSARVTDNFGATAVTAAISVSVAVPEAPMCFVLPVKPGSVP